jgi:hypothetical protein
MGGLRKSEQRGGGKQTVVTHPQRDGDGEENRGPKFGTHEPATAGTDGDADSSGVSKNEGHGHPREERDRRGE